MQSDDQNGSYSQIIYSHLESIFNTVVDGVVIIDSQGNIQAANPAIKRLFGYDAEELIGRNVSMLMPSPHKESHDHYIKSYRDTGVKKIIGIGRQVEGLKKDGSLFPFRLSISESVIDGQRYFTGIIHDITEIKQAQDDLELINKQLEKIVSERTNELTETVNKLLMANTMLKKEISLRQKTENDLELALEKEKELGILKSQFVTMASHEFRTPLSTILSSSNILARYTLTDEQKKRDKHIAKIGSAVRNMTNILEDILSLGKLEEGKIDNQPETFELVEFAQEVTEKLDDILKDGQNIELTSLPNKIQVHWSKNLTENIFNNLVSNAIKYSGDHSAVEIKLKQSEDRVQIEIKDHGIGIPKGQQKHLFERFFRASNAMNIKGTGLGLHIVKGYVTLMQGDIKFKSKQGEGSVFTLNIPLKPMN